MRWIKREEKSVTLEFSTGFCLLSHETVLVIKTTYLKQLFIAFIIYFTNCSFSIPCVNFSSG